MDLQMIYRSLILIFFTISFARQYAVNKALKNIIELDSGVEITSTSLSILSETNLKIDIDHFSQIINSMSQGIILEKEILVDKKQTINNSLWIYTVALKADSSYWVVS